MRHGFFATLPIRRNPDSDKKRKGIPEERRQLFIAIKSRASTSPKSPKEIYEQEKKKVEQGRLPRHTTD